MTAVLVATVFALAACGSKSDSGGATSGGGGTGGGGGPTPGPQPVETLALKSSGVKKIMIGHKADLRIYLKNYDKAAYQIVPGSSRTKWDHPRLPILKFLEGGQVTIAVTDTETLVQVEIKMLVVFDSTGIGPGFPGDLPEVPGEPPLIL
jgi:hypothetical protein